MERKANWLIGIPEAVKRWRVDMWRDPPENAQDIYDFNLASTFGSEAGQYVLNTWLRDIYCTVSYQKDLAPHDVSYNDGMRAFIHEILQDLDRIQNKKQLIEEPENAESGESEIQSGVR